MPTAPGAPVLKVAGLTSRVLPVTEVRATGQSGRGGGAVLVLERCASEEVPDLEALFAPLHFYASRSEETAIVSRHPLRDVKEVELPSFQASLRRPNRLEDLGSRGRRSFLHAQLDMQGFAIHVISIRFIAGRPPSTRPGSARVGTH